MASKAYDNYTGLYARHWWLLTSQMQSLPNQVREWLREQERICDAELKEAAKVLRAELGIQWDVENFAKEWAAEIVNGVKEARNEPLEPA